MQDRNLSMREFCELVGVSRQTVTRLLKAKKISCFRVGLGDKKRVLFAPAHIAEFLRACERPAPVSK